MLAAAPTRGQEAFRATHYSSLNGFYVVPPVSTDAGGLAIMRFDAQAGTLE